jgi:hypothetical protein
MTVLTEQIRYFLDELNFQFHDRYNSNQQDLGASWVQTTFQFRDGATQTGAVQQDFVTDD